MRVIARRLSFLLCIAVFCAGWAQTIAPALTIVISGPQQIKAGAPVKLDIVVTNQSKNPILYGSDVPGRGEHNFLFEVLDSAGKPAAKTQYNKALNGEDQGPGPQIVVLGKALEFTLQPGATINDRANLSELFELGPGEYTVRVSRHEGFHTIVQKNPSRERKRAQAAPVATSNTLRFTVVP